MRKFYDLVIIGAGAAGNAIAKEVDDIEALVIDKKRSIGEPVECAGLVSRKTLENLNMVSPSLIQSEIYGAYIHSPKGEVYKIGGDRLHAYSIDRALLDRHMAEIAESRGAEYLLKEDVHFLYRENGKILIKTHNNEFETKLLIGADGADSITRKIFFKYEPEETLLCIGAEVENIDIDPNMVHVFFGKEIAPGFFAWIIPTSKKGNRSRIGLCTTTPLVKPLKTLLHNLFNYPTTRPILENAEIRRFIGGKIPLGYIKESIKDNVILIGDSAFQVKPISGGGIYPISEASQVCLSTIKHAFNIGRFDKGMLKMYHSGWSDLLKKEIMFGMWIRKKFAKMRDEEIEKILSYLKKEEIVGTINRYGDIDHPSKLIPPLAKKIPILITLLPKLISLFI